MFPAMMIEGKKKPPVTWGKGEDGHPDLTKQRATIDPETVKAWWARWPLAMIGMSTGKPSGVVILDIDRKNGVDVLANLRTVGIDPYSFSTVISITPSGGLHVFMRYNGPLKNSAGLLAAGVDIRGDGGYVVLPPSLPYITRDEYQWEGAAMGVFDLPECPTDLWALEDTKRGEKWARRALEAVAAIVAGTMNGTRNTTLNNAALKLGRKVASAYLQAAEVEAALMEASQRSGLTQEDGPEAVRATIRSGLTAGLQEPEHPQDRPDYRLAPRSPTII